MAVGASSSSRDGSWVMFALAVVWLIRACMASQIVIGARLVAGDRERNAWVSDNSTFAFGFSPASSGAVDRFLLAIWFAKLPGDRTVVWSANRLVFIYILIVQYRVRWSSCIFILMIIVEYSLEYDKQSPLSTVCQLSC